MAIAFLIAGGKIAMGSWHYAAHFGAFAVLAAVWVLGLPRVAVVAVMAGVVVFGFLHEWSEILGHPHRFEFADAIVDGIGAAVGAMGARAFRRRAKAKRT
jgi:hypothetical protein